MRRAQVFIEALIVEVSASKAAQFGIQWQVLQGVSKSFGDRHLIQFAELFNELLQE